MRIEAITLISNTHCKVILVDEHAHYQGVARLVDEELYGFGFDDDLYEPLSREPMKIQMLVRLLTAVFKGETVCLPVDM